ncbi:alternate-type signal peptide domain-containing protein [Leucobacter sp. HY1908]
MKKQAQGIIAGAAGAALLLGGTTFALWSDSEDVAGATITAGNLDVTLEKSEWFDVSADRTDSGHVIADLATHRVVPGDTIEGRYTVTPELEGENLVANLALAYDDAHTGDLLTGLELSYSVRDADDTVIATGGANGVALNFASNDNGNKGALPVVTAGATYTVVVTAAFDAATAEQDLVQTTAALSEGAIELNQVREDAHGYN